MKMVNFIYHLLTIIPKMLHIVILLTTKQCKEFNIRAINYHIGKIFLCWMIALQVF
jgi:hypothetical protein